MLGNVDAIPIWLGAVATVIALFTPLVIAARRRSDANEARTRRIMDAVETISGLPSEGGRDPVEPLPTIVKRQGEQVQAVSGQVAALQTGQDAFHGRIESQVKEVGEAVRAVAQQVEIQNSDVAVVVATAQTVETRLTAIDGHLRTMNGRIGKLENQEDK